MKNTKNEKLWAHTLSKAHFEENSKNQAVSEPTFSDVKTGHRTPDTEHLKKENGPVESRSKVSSAGCPVSRQCSVPGARFPVCCQAQMDSLTQKETTKLLTRNWTQLKENLEFLGTNLAKWNLVKAIKILSEARKRRFLRRRTPKYGSMNKGFTDAELEKFFSVIDNPKAHLLFSFQAVMGLRIGEAVRISVKDINLKKRELRIFTEKTEKTDYLLIPVVFFDAVLHYIDTYQEEIAKANGLLFFSQKQAYKKHDTGPHITSETARVLFHRYVRKAKLEEIYGYSMGGKVKPLYRLTPHSLRHYAITNFCRKNSGNVMLASRFARHTNLQTTQIYLHVDKNELYESIERAQDDRLLRRVRRMQEKIN